MINVFARETGVNVEDVYWVGNIGHHTKSLKSKMMNSILNAIKSIKNGDSENTKPSTKNNYDPIDLETMKSMWGQTAWFNTFYQGLKIDSLDSTLVEISKLPGINEVLLSEHIDLNHVQLTVNAGDWKPHAGLNEAVKETTDGSVLVCLQAPHGCMIQAGESKIKVRKGDVIILNDRRAHCVMPERPIYMPRVNADDQVKWINEHGMLFVQLEVVKKAA